MLERYTRKEMGQVWTSENRFRKMLEVEKAVAQVQAEMGLIPKEAAQAIQARADFELQNILEKEKKTRHEITAFVSEVADKVGEPGASYIHWGLTSSDVLDTSFALLVRSAMEVLKKSFTHLERVLCDQSLKYADALCCGRTHGMRAEPLTFGLKLQGYLMELRRNEARVFRAVDQMMVAKLSGAVGAYGTLPLELEKRVCEKLNLTPELVATQVIPRDRYAELVMSLALTASGLERLAVEIRHLQRSEVGEVSEGFSKGQQGSSAMPHKKNPIYSENVTGLSRLIRSYVSVALENNVLWHERDISHSSAERVMFSSLFILSDFALNRMAEVMSNLQVNRERMLQNLRAGRGVEFSSMFLTILVKKGFSRAEAYRLVQSVSFSLEEGETLEAKLLKNKQVLKTLSVEEVRQAFSSEKRGQELSQRVKILLKKRK